MSQGGFQVIGNKATIVKELLLAIANKEGIEKILVFVRLLQALAGKKDLKSLSAITSQRAINAVDGSRLNQVLEFSFKESHRAIPLEEVASKANMTMTAFCKYFKTRTGKTYSAFLNGIRVNNACKALLESDEPIANIGYQTGFNNLSNFNRIFKSITGTTPKAYRTIN
jgi:AraC-like DNA-binding protein